MFYGPIIGFLVFGFPSDISSNEGVLLILLIICGSFSFWLCYRWILSLVSHKNVTVCCPAFCYHIIDFIFFSSAGYFYQMIIEKKSSFALYVRKVYLWLWVLDHQHDSCIRGSQREPLESFLVKVYNANDYCLRSNSGHIEHGIHITNPPISNSLSFPFDLICRSERWDTPISHSIKLISVSLEHSI